MQRNRQVRVQELTDIVAVRAESESGRQRGTEPVPNVLSQVVSAETLRAFTDAGWTFRRRAAVEPATEGEPAPVFVRSGGRLALGTNQLTVRFPSDLSEEAANAALQPFGCQVVQRLRFAPGLFQVSIVDQHRGDVIAVANQLSASGLVEFAEPVLLEVAGARSG